MENNNFYVYALYDPDETFPFYIGKGTNIEYRSGSEAARQLGIKQQIVHKRIKSLNFPNYNYKVEDIV